MTTGLLLGCACWICTVTSGFVSQVNYGLLLAEQKALEEATEDREVRYQQMMREFFRVQEAQLRQLDASIAQWQSLSNHSDRTPIQD